MYYVHIGAKNIRFNLRACRWLPRWQFVPGTLLQNRRPAADASIWDACSSGGSILQICCYETGAPLSLSLSLSLTHTHTHTHIKYTRTCRLLFLLTSFICTEATVFATCKSESGRERAAYIAFWLAVWGLEQWRERERERRREREREKDRERRRARERARGGIQRSPYVGGVI